jgi:hypothetical protein
LDHIIFFFPLRRGSRIRIWRRWLVLGPGQVRRPRWLVLGPGQVRRPGFDFTAAEPGSRNKKVRYFRKKTGGTFEFSKNS